MIEFDAVVAAPERLALRLQQNGDGSTRAGIAWGVGIKIAGDVLTEMVYVPASVKSKAPAKPLAKKVVQQLKAYFKDPSASFDLPLKPVGTAHQQKVWQVIRAIPAGNLLSYGEVAKMVHSAPRAVGQACGANWYSLVVPCHRVVAAGQRGYTLGGFSHHDDEDGFHLQIKRALLAHEGVTL